MKKLNSKLGEIKGDDRKSMPFNHNQDKSETEEKKNKTITHSKNALHNKSLTEEPLSEEKRERLIEEENGLGHAKRQGTLKSKLKKK